MAAGLTLALTAMLSASCSSSGSAAHTHPGAADGSALQGSNACGTSTATLTKQVPLTVGQGPSDIAVGPAWLSHSSESYVSFLYGAIKLTNTGTVGRCFVEARAISFRDAAGAEVTNNPISFVYGEVNVLGSVTTGTCLGPGKSAFINLIEPFSYFDVAALHLDWIEYQNAGTAPRAQLEATGYAVTGTQVAIVAANHGTGIANQVSLTAYAMDAENQFLFWGFPTLSNRDQWAPDEVRTATTSFGYQAPCPKLHVVIDFEAGELASTFTTRASLAARGASDDHTEVEALVQQRQQLELAKLNQLLH
jgi:hypothetical protein